MPIARYRDDLLLDQDPDVDVARGVPGRVPVTARLAPRATTQIIFRVADRETASALGSSLAAVGGSDGAERAIDAAASTSGQPLPDHVRSRFEASLGTSLDTVRVHHGPESAVAARAVGARAYTVGQDIHFGEGEYAHDDPFGLHLLAHEVAHTVQQRGGVARRQDKLEVSSPGDAAEVEADRAADRMVRGEATHVEVSSTSLSREPRSVVDEAEADRQAEVDEHRPNWVETSPDAHPSGEREPRAPADGSSSPRWPVPPAPDPTRRSDVESSRPADMEAMGWKALAQAAPGPTSPGQIAIAVSGSPPLPSGVTRDPTDTSVPRDTCNPRSDSPFKQPARRYDFSIFDERRAAWAAFGGACGAVTSIYNQVAPHIQNFNNAESNPSLAELGEFQPGSGGRESLDHRVDQQVVPRTNDGGLRVKDVFDNQQFDGVEVQSAKAKRDGLDDNIARAAKSPKVEAALTALRAANAKLEAASAGWRSSQSALEQATHAANAADFGVKLTKAEEEREDAQSYKAGLEGKAKEAKEALGLILNVVKVASGMWANPVAAAAGGGIIEVGGAAVAELKPHEAKMRPGAGAAGKASKVVGESVTTKILEKIVDHYMSSDIATAKRKLEAATSNYRSARGGAANEAWLAASAGISSAEAAVQEKLSMVKAEVHLVRNAYLALAEAAAEAGGGSKEEQNRMKALIRAIPVVKVVVNAASNVLNGLGDPPSSQPDQIGYSMALVAGHPAAPAITRHYGELKGWRQEYQIKLDFWSSRLASLEAVIGDLAQV